MCSFRLLSSWREDPLPEDSPIIESQIYIDAALATHGQLHVIDDIRAIMIAISHAGMAAEIAAAAGKDRGSLVGLGEKAIHVGADAPGDSLTMGSLCALAVKILTHDDDETDQLIRKITFSYRDGSPPEFNSRSQGSALEILSRFPEASPTLRRQILRSVDEDLSVLHRLVHQSPLGRGRELYANEIQQDAAAMHLPLQLWANWTQPLDHGGNYSPDALRQSLIAAVSFVIRYAAGEHVTARDKGWLRRQLRGNLLGDEIATTRTLAQICELANLLQRTVTVIRYDLRPSLAWDLFLAREEWIDIADAAGFHPGSSNRHKLAKRYLYSRLNESNGDRAPDMWFDEGGDSASKYTSFCLSITSGLRDALDDYARAFLHLHGLDEPVTWAPGRDHVENLATAGPELHDIDMDTLYDMILSAGRGRTPSQKSMAKAVGRSMRHVRLSLEAWPLPSGKIDDINWSQRMLRSLDQAPDGQRLSFQRRYGLTLIEG